MYDDDVAYERMYVGARCSCKVCVHSKVLDTEHSMRSSTNTAYTAQHSMRSSTNTAYTAQHSMRSSTNTAYTPQRIHATTYRTVGLCTLFHEITLVHLTAYSDQLTPRFPVALPFSSFLSWRLFCSRCLSFYILFHSSIRVSHLLALSALFPLALFPLASSWPVHFLSPFLTISLAASLSYGSYGSYDS